jgi:hypothetical protein
MGEAEVGSGSQKLQWNISEFKIEGSGSQSRKWKMGNSHGKNRRQGSKEGSCLKTKFVKSTEISQAFSYLQTSMKVKCDCQVTSLFFADQLRKTVSLRRVPITSF